MGEYDYNYQNECEVFADTAKRGFLALFDLLGRTI